MNRNDLMNRNDVQSTEPQIPMATDQYSSSTLRGVEPGFDSQVWLRRGAAVVAALIVVAIGFLVIKGLGGDNSSSGKPQAVDASRLSNLTDGTGHPVYWAGPTPPSSSYEWWELANGRIYVRYLTGGALPGDKRSSFLTIGTYPVGNGPRALRKADKFPGNRLLKVHGGGTALVNSKSSSVYLAFPNSPYEIEVFDPDPSKALRLVASGKIHPIP
jgi:hypothetical protein